MAPKKVSHYQESLHRIKNRQYSYISNQFDLICDISCCEWVVV